MHRATLALPTVVQRDDGMRSSSGPGRALRVAVVAAALVAGIACVTMLSKNGPVELDEPSFGAHSLTPFPVKQEPSTDDLIAIMRGQGHSDVNADQGMLFAGGAGGTIVRKRVHLTDGDAADEARGLWAAAERASKLERLDKTTSSQSDDDLDSAGDAHDNMAVAVTAEPSAIVPRADAVKQPAPVRKVAAGWTDVGEKHKSTKMLARPTSVKAAEKKAAKKIVAKKDESPDMVLHNIEKSGSDLDVEHVAATAATAKETTHPKKPPAGVEQHAAHQVTSEKSDRASVKSAQDDYFKRHVSIDDALSRVAKIRAVHEARASAEVRNKKMAQERAKELKEEHAERSKAVAEAGRAEVMQAMQAVSAANEAETDEARSWHDAVREEQQRELKQHEVQQLTQEKQQLARTKAVKAGWTKADAVRAAQLAKQFALESHQPLASMRASAKAVTSGPVKATAVYAGASLAHRQLTLANAEDKVKADEEHIASAQHERTADMSAQASDDAISPYYPTGFIPSSKQHDDAHRPDAMPEMIAGIHAAHHKKDGALDKYAQSLTRQSKMEGDEEIEEKVRADEVRTQKQLYTDGHAQASRDGLKHAGEKLVNEMSSAADVARVVEKVDFSGIAVKSSLKEAIAGDEAHFRAFEQHTWMDECGGSQLMLGPVAKQVLAIMQQISTKNASAWLDVEDAQRRADNANADLHAAEAGLVSVLESHDRTKAVKLLETLREQRQQRLAQRRADQDTAADAEDSGDKTRLLLQQREALKVLSHAEEAQAVSGDERRVELNKAAFDAQRAVTVQDKLDDAHASSKYVSGFQSALLATATRPWSLSAQEAVQTLLGNINVKILALEHTEQARSKGLSSLEAKVAARMHLLSEVDAADEMLKAHLAKEHTAVEQMRNVDDEQSKALMRVSRAYRVRLTEDAAELRGAHQVVNRLQALVDVCNLVLEAPRNHGTALEGNPFDTRPTNLAAIAVKPWVKKATNSLSTSLPSAAQLDLPSPPQEQQQLRKRRRAEVVLQHPAAEARQQTVAQLGKHLQLPHPLAARAKARAARSDAPTAQGLSMSRWGRRQAEDRLLQKEIAAANADESTMEHSEEQKLSSVASMIVSDPHDGRR